MYQTLAFGCCERFSKKLERMIEICASLSRTLVEEHCMHVVAWFDQKNVRVVRWRVKDEETFL